MGRFHTAMGLAAHSGLTGVVAAALVMFGGGIGAVAALATSPASATTAHSSLPPVNVSVANTPTVKVGNLTTNSVGRLRVQNQADTSHVTIGFPWTSVPNGQWVTVDNVSGSGRVTGLQVANAIPGGSCNYVGDTLVVVTTDGNQAFRGWVSQATDWGNESSIYGGAGPCQGYGPWFSLHYFPPGGIPFQNSMSVQMITFPNGNGPMPQLWYYVYYQTQAGR